MARFQLSPGGLDGGDSMVDLVNIMSGAQQKELDRASQEAKATVSSLIQSYNSAKSVALQGEIVNTMRDYHSQLSPHLQQQVAPYIKHGPTSEISEKTRQFLLHNKPPKPPVLNEAPGAEMSNKYTQANYMFSAADYKRKLNSFVYGATSAGEKQNYIGLEDGSAAIRGADGQVMIMSQQDLGLKELSEETGIPVREMLLNPNGVSTGQKGFMNIGGRKITSEVVFKPFEPNPNKRYGQRMINTEAMPKSAWDIDHPTSLRKMLLEWKNPSTDDDLIKDLRNRSAKQPVKVAEELSEIWSQYSFRVVDIKKEGWFKKVANILPLVSANNLSAVIPIRGQPTAFLDVNGKDVWYYYDSELDLVSNAFGKHEGTYQDIAQRVSILDSTKKKEGK